MNFFKTLTCRQSVAESKFRKMGNTLSPQALTNPELDASTLTRFDDKTLFNVMVSGGLFLLFLGLHICKTISLIFGAARLA